MPQSSARSFRRGVLTQPSGPGRVAVRPPRLGHFQHRKVAALVSDVPVAQVSEPPLDPAAWQLLDIGGKDRHRRGRVSTTSLLPGVGSLPVEARGGSAAGGQPVEHHGVRIRSRLTADSTDLDGQSSCGTRRRSRSAGRPVNRPAHRQWSAAGWFAAASSRRRSARNVGSRPPSDPPSLSDPFRRPRARSRMG